jgi:hypothetical protein
LEVLDEDECYILLGSTEVARFAVVDGGAALVVPVNYIVAGRDIVVRTAAGPKLTAARRAPVTLEVDAIDPARRTGWSVMVRGRAEEITAYDAEAVQQLRELPFSPWAGDKPVWLRIRPSVVSGRRLVQPDAPAADAPAADAPAADAPAAESPAPDAPAADAPAPGASPSRPRSPTEVSSPPIRRRPLVIRRLDRPDRGPRRRHATFEAVDEAGERLGLATYDGPLAYPRAAVVLEFASGLGSDEVHVGAELLRRLSDWAVVDGVRDLVVHFGHDDHLGPRVLDASGVVWSRADHGGVVRAYLSLSAHGRWLPEVEKAPDPDPDPAPDPRPNPTPDPDPDPTPDPVTSAPDPVN